jgi:conjugative transposon TraM protein
MTQFPNTDTDNKADVPYEEKQELSEQNKGRAARLKAKLKFYGFVALMVIMCAVFIWFVFKPDNSRQEEVGGLNFSIPEASLQTTESDKRKALEIAEMQDKQRERVRNLMDFDTTQTQAMTEDVIPDMMSTGQVSRASPINESQQTARVLNAQMHSFYQEPKEDPQVAELKQQVEELKEVMARQQQAADMRVEPVNEMELLEKSFEMAARYMPNQTGTTDTTQPAQPEKDREIMVVRRVDDNPVSSLMEFEFTPQERNYEFVTAAGNQSVNISNAIRACVNSDQVITVGAQVTLRLLEPLSVAGYVVPVNAPVYGIANIQGQRLWIQVTSIESEGNIIPVELTVHDMDGQIGINVPTSMERVAAKNALAGIGQSFGTSISFAESAGQQVAMDLTRGVMNGASQYVASKMREVKVNLKTGYQVLLIAK